jgi:lysophospholipase L1-like esterase
LQSVLAQFNIFDEERRKVFTQFSRKAACFIAADLLDFDGRGRGQKASGQNTQARRRGKRVDPKILRTLVDIRRAPSGRWLAVPKGSPTEQTRMRMETLEASVGLDGVMDIHRAFKEKRYRQTIKNPKYRGPRIVAEGDSWFEYPLTNDILMWLGGRYAVLSLAKAGDSWHEIIEQNELFDTIKKEKPHIVMLSVGGNDVLGNVGPYVNENNPALPPAAHIKASFKDLLDWTENIYRDVTSRIIAMSPQLKVPVQVILHGYDYPDPRPGNEGGYLIGGPLERLGFGGVGMWREIVNTMLDQFNARLMRVADGQRVHYTKLLKTIGTDDILTGPDESNWNDEAHGSDKGFQALATQLQDKIAEIYPAA